ncbi:MAG: PEP/pyruvate-binding domain-containing protein [Gammaproteobacteria bacterium]
MEYHNLKSHATRYTLPFEECDTASCSQIGGKNAGLGGMIKANAPVPPGFAIITEAYRKMLITGNLGKQIHTLLEQPDSVDMKSDAATSRAIRNLIERTPIPDDIEQAIRTAYMDLCQQCQLDNVPVAVRSSATAEDLPGTSFAGQQDTFLWVVGINEILRHVSKCWSSVYTSRAIAYRNEKKFSHKDVYMSVGIQKMVNARAAGVMFTLNPVSGDRSKVVIDASWGLGESVVGGEVTPDNYVVDKIAMKIIKKTVSSKTIEYRADPRNKCVRRVEVPPARQTIQCLSDDAILTLTKYANIAEKHFGSPQDLEWAIDADLRPPDNILLLQSRPETVWSGQKRTFISSDKKSALDNIVSNLITGVKIKLHDKR